jgi:TRAP-type C4-dicarboxylate transport system permease small subunit
MDKKPKGVIEWIEQICLGIAGAGLMLLMLLTTVDTLARYLFNTPLTGVVEFSEEYLMITIIFLPLSYVYIAGGHIKIELLERFFPAKVKKVTEKINIVFGLILFALIVYAFIPSVQQAIEINEVSSCALAYPMAPAYIMVTLGCLLICIRSIQAFLGKIDIDH